MSKQAVKDFYTALATLLTTPDNIKKIVAEQAQDDYLTHSAMSDMLKVARHYGYDVTKDDVREYMEEMQALANNPAGDGDNVICQCTASGFGDFNNDDATCACVLGGGGYSAKDDSCVCVALGFGVE